MVFFSFGKKVTISVESPLQIISTFHEYFFYLLYLVLGYVLKAFFSVSSYV